MCKLQTIYVSSIRMVKVLQNRDITKGNFYFIRNFVYFPLIFILSVQIELYALDPSKSIKQFGHEAWGVDRGFPYFVIHSIIQSPDGYLWLATDDGLVRFDGIQFVLFNENNNKAFKNSKISSLAVDHNNVLWIGTRGGGLVAYQNGAFQYEGTKGGIPYDFIYVMYVDKENALWLGVEKYGIVKRQNGHSKIYTDANRLSLSPMFCLSEFNDGTIVSGIGKLAIKPPGSDSFFYPAPNRIFVKAVAEDQNGVRWIGTEQGIFTFHENQLTLCTIPGAPVGKPISSMLIDRAGSLWIGTEGYGLYRYANARFDSFKVNDGLSSDRILSLYEDRENNLWLGTRGGGLYRIRDRNITTISREDGLDDDYVTCLYEDRDSVLWIGTREHNISVIKNWKVVPAPYIQKEKLTFPVRSFIENEQGTLFIGTQHKLYSVSKNREGSSELREVHSKILDNFNVSIRSLYSGWKSDTLLVALYGPGLYGFANNTIFPILPATRNRKSGYIRTILPYQENSLLFCTQEGIACFRDSVLFQYSTANGLSDDQAFALYTEKNGIIWVGTYGGGLCRIKDGQITVYNRSIGLFDNSIFCILEDDNGNFWMSGNKGVFTVSKQQLNDYAEKKITSINCVSYGLRDGMKSVECNGGSQFAGVKTHDGKFVFATVKGIVIIDPANFFTNPLAPPVHIEQIIADDETLQTSKTLTLNAGIKSLQIDYTGLSFSIPEKVKFKYFLEGFDNHWIDAGSRRKAYYTNIPSGNYTFRVIACNNSGVWNNTGEAITIILPPFFWETTLFRFSSATIIILGILLIIKRRETTIKKREQEKLAIQKQLMDLESRALRAQMNPHFIFNSLNSIQECILSEKTEAACEYLSKFARLIRIALESSEKTVIHLEKEIQSLELYLQLESLRFDGKFEYTLDITSEVNDIPIEIPAMLIQPYVENAIWHGLLHKPDNRKLLVSLRFQDEILLCTIEDNGIGRQKASEYKNVHKEGYESKGMRVTRERLEMMNKSSGINAKVLIIDLFDSENQAIGTKVELYIPIIK